MKLAWSEQGTSVAALTIQISSLYLIPEWSATRRMPREGVPGHFSREVRLTSSGRALVPAEPHLLVGGPAPVAMPTRS
jgi:hypothetical protein